MVNWIERCEDELDSDDLAITGSAITGEGQGELMSPWCESSSFFFKIVFFTFFSVRTLPFGMFSGMTQEAADIKGSIIIIICDAGAIAALPWCFTMAKTSGVNDPKLIMDSWSPLTFHLHNWWGDFGKLQWQSKYEFMPLADYDLMMLILNQIMPHCWLKTLDFQTWLRKTQTLHWEQNCYQNQPAFWDYGIQIMLVQLQQSRQTYCYYCMHHIIAWLLTLI